jgi:hypothetical protein
MLQELKNLGFRVCEGSSLSEEQLNSLLRGEVVVRKKSGGHVKIFIQIGESRLAKICPLAEKDMVLQEIEKLLATATS